jgi:hypothetical protein
VVATLNAELVQIEADHPLRAEIVRSQRKQSAPAADIEEVLAPEVREIQEFDQGCLGHPDPLIVQGIKEGSPVFAK